MPLPGLSFGMRHHPPPLPHSMSHAFYKTFAIKAPRLMMEQAWTSRDAGCRRPSHLLNGVAFPPTKKALNLR